MKSSPAPQFCSLTICTLVLGVILALNPSTLNAASAASYGFAGSIPSASLPDPAGKTFNISQNNGKPTVILVSVPDLSQGDIQKSWVSSLSSLSSGINFYLVENMKGTMFQSIALGDMKNDYKEGDRPVVLIDSVGSVSKQLGSPKGKTCVMIFNSSNRLVYVQVGNASSTAVQAVNQVIGGL